MVEEEVHICPDCGSPDAMPIVYGLLMRGLSREADELMDKIDAGEVCSGGCLCSGDDRDPKWCCRDCGTFYGGKSQER